MCGWPSSSGYRGGAAPTIAGLVVGLIAIQLPQVLGIGYEATRLTLAGQYDLLLLVAIWWGRSFARRPAGAGLRRWRILAFAADRRGAGGRIRPAGGLVAVGDIGVIDAIVGMGAVAAAVLGAPISTVLIVFELTGSYPMAVGSMVAVVFAVGLSRTLTGHSFFTRQLQSMGHDIRDGKDISLRTLGFRGAG